MTYRNTRRRLEAFVQQGKRSAFFELLELAGRLTVLTAVIFYIAGIGERARERNYQAWQVINTAAGLSGSGGRLDALQALMADQVSVTGVNLSGWVEHGIHLPGAWLPLAIFDSTVLDDGSLAGANLTQASFRGAWLWNMRLESAVLNQADLGGVVIHLSHLDSAELWRASLKNANLFVSDLQGADFAFADLRGLTLHGMPFRNIWRIKLANVCGAKPDEFRQWALDSAGAVCVEDDDVWRAFPDSVLNAMLNAQDLSIAAVLNTQDRRLTEAEKLLSRRHFPIQRPPR